MDIRLIMFTDRGERREFPLHKPRILVGRTVDADLRIPLSVVSRRQCEILRDGDTATIRDLGSSNGTLVNGARVEQAQLKAGDEIAVGPVTFTVVVNGHPTKVRPQADREDHSSSRNLLPAMIDDEEAAVFDTEPTVFSDRKESVRAERASASIERESKPGLSDTGKNLPDAQQPSADGGEIDLMTDEDEPAGDEEDPIAALEALARQIGADGSPAKPTDKT